MQTKMNENRCIFCKSDLSNKERIANSLLCSVQCPRCGEYKINSLEEAKLADLNLNSLQIANISGWIRENGIEVYKDIRNDLISISKKTPFVAQKAEKLLRHFVKDFPAPGKPFKVDFNDLKFLGIAWAQNSREVEFLVNEYLFKTNNFLKMLNNNSVPDYRITPEGWAYLRAINPDSQLGFIAMWFNKELDSLLEEVLEPAIEGAGYEPKRIDKHEHINRIDDEILVMIKRSKFIVADFTGQRGGVYFEAGYALGLGLPVFWLCKKEEIDIKEIHFDTRQYNFIQWEEDKLDEVKKALQYRIERILGKGKYSKDKDMK